MHYSNFSKMVRLGSDRVGGIEEHVPALLKLHQTYRDRPMSLADPCIVRMAEIYERHAVFTLNSDFTVYRKSGRVPLELIHPTQG